MALTQTEEEVQSAIDWEISKASGDGIKVDTAAPTFPWHDLIGMIQPDTSNPTTSPTKEVFRTGVNAFAFNVSDEVDSVFHIPHDWVLGSDSYMHMHWAHNGTAISGNIVVGVTATYASRDGATVFHSPVSLVNITVSTPDIATIPQYKHFVTEVPLTTATPSANEIDSDLVEVDGIFLITAKVLTAPAVTAGDFFIFTGDIHYQSTGIGTKQRADPFYT